MQTNAKKCQEMQKNTKKCQEIPRNALWEGSGIICHLGGLWEVSGKLWQPWALQRLLRGLGTIIGIPLS